MTPTRLCRCPAPPGAAFIKDSTISAKSISQKLTCLLLASVLGSLRLLPGGGGPSGADTDQELPDEEQLAMAGRPSNWFLWYSGAPAADK